MLSTAGISIKQLPNCALGERRKCKIFPKKSVRRIQSTSTEFTVSCLAALLTPGVLGQIGIHEVGGPLMYFLYFCSPVSPILHLFWGFRWVFMDRGKVLMCPYPWETQELPQTLPRLHCEFPWCIKISVEHKCHGRAQKRCPALRHWIISFRDSYQRCFGLVNFLFLSQTLTAFVCCCYQGICMH